ncbi:hypothetical protein BREVNS_0728 [Brevinematales bacterium NS]|nr:hypothetical protein [Brevinematales bacterium]QJR21478.1 hypothetical protein BREVNS_0728 [Brevinematales bacterium NS]
MNRDYFVSLVTYIVYGGVILIGVLFFAPFLLLAFLEEIKTGQFWQLSFTQIVGGLVGIVGGLAYLLSDAFVTVVWAPIISYWRISIREDGIYGWKLWEIHRIWKDCPRKICSWEEVERLQWLAWFDMGASRTKVFLKNGSGFYITNLGDSPSDRLIYTTDDEREKRLKYSYIMMYALIMKRIGEGKFEGFERGRVGFSDEKVLLRAIKYVLETEVDGIIEEDRRRLARMKELEEEYEREKREEMEKEGGYRV